MVNHIEIIIGCYVWDALWQNNDVNHILTTTKTGSRTQTKLTETQQLEPKYYLYLRSKFHSFGLAIGFHRRATITLNNYRSISQP